MPETIVYLPGIAGDTGISPALRGMFSDFEDRWWPENAGSV